MKEFLNRILGDSYNFNKLDRVLELKLIDTQEKYENHQKVEDLLNFRKELSNIRSLLLSENLCKIYKSCKIISFLLSYSFIHHRSLTVQLSRGSLSNDSASSDDLHNPTSEYKDLPNNEGWNSYIGELTNTSLDSTSSHIENSLVNSHLIDLLQDLTLYLTHKQFNRTYKTLVNNVYSGVIKFYNSLNSGGRIGEIKCKLNEVILTILSYYHSTNQLQSDHINQLERLCKSSNRPFYVKNGHKGEKNVLKGSYDLMLKVNKNYLLDCVNNLDSLDVGFLTHMLSISSSSANSDSYDGVSELNMFNIYQLIIKLINDLSTKTTNNGINGPEKVSNNLESSHKADELFNLLKSVVALLNKDVALLHLNKIVEIVNMLFRYVCESIFSFRNRFVLTNYSGILLELLKCINRYCTNFSSLVNFQLLAEMVDNYSTSDFNLNKRISGFSSGNGAPNDTHVSPELSIDSLRLYVYLIDNRLLETLMSKSMHDELINWALFDQYVSNILINNTDYNKSLLLEVYTVVKQRGNNSLMGKLQFLLSQ